MQAEVRSVRVPDSINALMDDVLCLLRKEGIHVSDRKYFGFAPLAQARAWLCGRDEVRPGDLGILLAYLWTTPEEIEKIQRIITERIENPLGDRIRDIHSQAAEAFNEFKDDVGKNAPRAMVKLRTGFIALYKEIEALAKDAQSDRDKEAVTQLLESVDNMNRQACSASNLTYIPVNELARLEN
jgi:MoxR-like ATPase